MSEEKAPVSVVVITKNEEKRLGPCLDTCKWAKEIIVLDDESTDRTKEIAARYTDKIIARKMDYEGRHRNFGYDQASQPWVLSLDADEHVTPELAKEIIEVLKENKGNHTCYAIPMKIFIGKEWVRGAGYYPSARSKLFKKGEFKYEDQGKVHPRVFYQGSSGLLKGELMHYSFRDMEDFIKKFNRETTLEAEKWMIDGRKVSFLNCFRKMNDRFFKNFILKKGYQCGFLGYFVSVFHGLYHIVTYAKYRELKGINKP
jgi:glycosyltransferase involved in cell wall biosynthesis